MVHGRQLSHITFRVELRAGIYLCYCIFDVKLCIIQYRSPLNESKCQKCSIGLHIDRKLTGLRWLVHILQ